MGRNMCEVGTCTVRDQVTAGEDPRSEGRSGGTTIKDISAEGEDLEAVQAART